MDAAQELRLAQAASPRDGSQAAPAFLGEISQSATGIADVNTNGIILEAISYVMAERTPFLAPEVTSGI